MGQSLSQLYVHLIFGTKGRYPYIKESMEKRVYEYLAATLKTYESPALIINGVPEHIHILFRLSKNHALAKVVEELKKQSSKWMKELDAANSGFSWQIGYAAFSVSSSGVNTVTNYIKNQKEHHSKKTFHDEIKEFMKKYDLIEFDENYFWS